MSEAEKRSEPLNIEWPAGEFDYRVTKKSLITIRLDDDVIAFFKRQGRGYQTRINAVLRYYMEHHQKAVK